MKECPEAKALLEIFLEYTVKSGKIPKDVVTEIADLKELKSLVNRIITGVPFDYKNLSR